MKTCEESRRRKQRMAEFIKAQPIEKRAAYIAVKSNMTEFELQSLLYWRLKEAGLEVRGEITTKCGTCRFDLVVVDGGMATRIIEVKRSRSSGKSRHKRAQVRKRGKQVERYKEFGLPVDLVTCLADAEKCIRQLCPLKV